MRGVKHEALMRSMKTMGMVSLWLGAIAAACFLCILLIGLVGPGTGLTAAILMGVAAQVFFSHKKDIEIERGIREPDSGDGLYPY